MESSVKSRVRPRRVLRALRRLFVVLLVAVIGFGAGFWVCLEKPDLGSLFNRGPLPEIVPEGVIAGEDYTLSVSTVEEVLKPAGELISSKYYYKDADIYEHYKQIWGVKLPLTTDKVVFTYDGYLGLGMELKDIDYEIDNDNRVITIVLPKLRILANEIDPASFEFPYMADSIFNDTRMDNYMELIDKLKSEKAEETMNNAELLEEALKNTQNVLRSFLTASELTKEYQVVFK